MEVDLYNADLTCKFKVRVEDRLACQLSIVVGVLNKDPFVVSLVSKSLAVVHVELTFCKGPIAVKEYVKTDRMHNCSQYRESPLV